jgi:alcohol dehydrogenase class IV
MNAFEKARKLLGEFKGDAYVYGAGVLDRAGTVTAPAGKRAALIRDSFPASDGYVAVIRDSLAEAGVDVAGEIKGAGSTIDAGKAAEVLRTLGGDIEGYFGTGLVTETAKKSGKTLSPHVAIQTAASSGAHLTKYSNITDVHTGQKKLIVDEAIVPSNPLFDHQVTYAAPRSLTADGALDGIAHCLEVLYGAVGQPAYGKIKEIAGTGIGLVVNYLPQVMGDPKDKAAEHAGTPYCGYDRRVHGSGS